MKIFNNIYHKYQIHSRANVISPGGGSKIVYFQGKMENKVDFCVTSGTASETILKSENQGYVSEKIENRGGRL
jgi:hypothetical protein